MNEATEELCPEKINMFKRIGLWREQLFGWEQREHCQEATEKVKDSALALKGLTDVANTAQFFEAF